MYGDMWPEQSDISRIQTDQSLMLLLYYVCLWKSLYYQFYRLRFESTIFCIRVEIVVDCLGHVNHYTIKAFPYKYMYQRGTQG